MFEFCVGHDFIEKNSHLSYKKDSFHLVNEIPTQVRMSCHIGMPFDIYIFNSRRHELFPNFSILIPNPQCLLWFLSMRN